MIQSDFVEVHLIFLWISLFLDKLRWITKKGIMTNNKTIKGNAPYFTKLIGFKNDEAFGKAMANAAKKLKS